MLDISMAYLQTNTRLENLEVVERVDKTTEKYDDWQTMKKEMIESPNFQLSNELSGIRINTKMENLYGI
jgi:hypothetical protein